MNNDVTLFWSFSIEYYRLLGVAPVLISLQGERGADVNMVLFGLWRAANGLLLSKEEYELLDRCVGSWRDSVVRPLREVRRSIKQWEGALQADAAGLYEQAKQIELQAEFLQQSLMQSEGDSVAPGRPSVHRKEAARLNLLAYARYLGTPFPPSSVQQLVSAGEHFPCAAFEEQSL